MKKVARGDQRNGPDGTAYLHGFREQFQNAHRALCDNDFICQ